jgi:type I restriction enzyme S subunit
MNLKYKKYDNYKPSGVEWLGDVPEHWGVKRVKAISRIKRGASPRPIADPRYFSDNGEYSWVRIADVTANSHYLLETKDTLSKLGANLSVKIYEGELFLSIAGSVGKPMISKIKCCIHDGFVYFPDLKKGQEFLYRIFETGRPYVGLGKHGTQLNLNTETIANIKIPFPPLEEQTAIANFLDHKTAQIDKAIAQKGQLIELLKERRQILIHEAVTQGLDKSVEMKDSGVEWIGDVPKHWEVKKLGYLTTRIGDGLHGTPNYTDDATYYFINGNNLGNEKIKITEQTKTVNIKEYLLHKKDLSGNTILLSINGTIGNVSYYNYEPIMLGKSAAYINLLSNVNIRYIRLFLQSSIFKNYYELELSGSTIKNLSLHSIGKTPIVIPPKEEQQEIVSYIEAQNEKIKTAIKLKQQEIASLKEYKTVLIDAAVTGKVIVD